ncbi:MAG: type II toxin-antitoxin system prevent-host-death family antitoxin [Chloroflexi bacterium]|nr:type II toxin-antitoxin system prevent-host-death family antitoxin [Chloroflexota bacterium]
MRTVGVGALRQRASELLRLVEQGETIEVTNHGRVVAVLGPPPEQSGWERLVATGEMILATRDIDELPEPLHAQPGGELPSARLARLRAHER